MKYLALLFLAVFASQALLAQTSICISYDAAGNRIQRKQCCTNCSLEGPTAPELAALAPSAQEERLSITPNPSMGVFTLDGKNIPPTAQVVVMSMTGARVLSRSFDNGQFDVSNLPPGVYVVSLQYDKTRKTLLLDKINH